MNVIRYDNLRSFCYSNDRLIEGEIKGITIDFFGLGGSAMPGDDYPDGLYYAGKGLIHIIPYTDPWNWMNPKAVTMTDEIIDVLFEQYALPADTPIVSTGGSMGGLCAIVYCRYAKRTPAACVANCPVCDLPYHFTERPDLPRTLYAAYYTPGGDLLASLKGSSPLHIAADLPDIPYTVFHCTADEAVNIDAHSEKFVAAMRAAGKKIGFHKVPDRGHCALTPEAWELYRQCICKGAGLKKVCTAGTENGGFEST